MLTTADSSGSAYSGFDLENLDLRFFRSIYKRLDFNNFITRKDIDPVLYDLKFKFVDYVLQKKDADELKYAMIWSDPTMFSYMHFKLDGKPCRLYDYQDLIINDPHRYKIFRAANQIGKSLLLDVKAAYNLIIDHGHAHNEAIVSKSLPQSMFQMRRVKGLLNTIEGLDWRESKGLADSMSVITVDIKDDDGSVMYTNMLVCAPCTEGLLGYDLHELNLDEFEYWDIDQQYFFNQIAQPRTYSTKGRITIFSNPNGMESFVAKLEEQTLKNSGRKKWHTYVFNYLDKPGNTVEEFEQLRSELSRQEFESTVAAIRSISSKNFFTMEEIERSYDPKLTELSMVGKQPFFFLDVGSKHDQSVLVGGYIEPDEHNEKLNHIYIPIIHVYPVGYPISRVVGADVDASDGWHYEKSVKDYLKEWSADGIQPVFGVDVTGNSGIAPLFESVGIQPENVTFSGPMKSGMYQRFKWYMEKGLLHRIKSEEFEYQASHLEMKKSQRGYLMIHHEKEDDLDDVMDAIAGLIYLADNPDIITPTLKII